MIILTEIIFLKAENQDMLKLFHVKGVYNEYPKDEYL
jgi:hypothetical protein